MVYRHNADYLRWRDRQDQQADFWLKHGYPDKNDGSTGKSSHHRSASEHAPRTTLSAVRLISCSCNVLPWENCRHTGKLFHVEQS